jgi:hypothetical protein
MIVLKTRVLHVKYDDYICSVAQIEMKTPQGEKLFFIVIASDQRKLLQLH